MEQCFVLPSRSANLLKVMVYLTCSADAGSIDDIEFNYIIIFLSTPGHSVNQVVSSFYDRIFMACRDRR